MTDDLTVISACMQDAVLKTGEIAFNKRDKPACAASQSLCLGKERQRLDIPERRRAILHFDRVMAVRSTGIDRKKPDECSCPSWRSSLNRQKYQPDKLKYALRAALLLRFDVECIEAQLADLGSAWAAKGKPKHGV